MLQRLFAAPSLLRRAATVRQPSSAWLSLVVPRLSTCPSTCRYSSNADAKQKPLASDPLRILFCGSDEFSWQSLSALHAEKERNPDLIRSIDVVVRPPKRTGRGLKTLRELPISILAKELKLPLHQLDTFRGWEIPQNYDEPINLIIAVSFGRFVPKRLLTAVKYGGLNIHPSFLPDLRGPAPIHHALLNGDTHAGISLQNLSHDSFDAGTVLMQTPRPGIPIPPSSTFSQLQDLLAPLGAEMLVQGLRTGVHVDQLSCIDGLPVPDNLRHAPPITSDKKQADWKTSAGNFMTRARALGPQWTIVTRSALAEGKKYKPVRIKLQTVEELTKEEEKHYVVGKEGSQKFVAMIAREPTTGDHDPESWSDKEYVLDPSAVPMFPDRLGTDSAVLCMLRGGMVRVKTLAVDGKGYQSPWRFLSHYALDMKLLQPEDSLDKDLLRQCEDWVKDT